jgi:hypothetical protein
MAITSLKMRAFHAYCSPSGLLAVKYKGSHYNMDWFLPKDKREKYNKFKVIQKST